MEKNNRSQQMLSYVPKYYHESKFYLAQNNSKGEEFNTLRDIIDDLLYQLNPQTATWGLALWEEFCGLPTIPELHMEERRKKILTLLSTISLMTKNTMQRLLNNMTGQELTITKNVRPYVFQVTIPDGIDMDYEYIAELIRDKKDAHIDFLFHNVMEGFYNRSIIDTASENQLYLTWWKYDEKHEPIYPNYKADLDINMSMKSAAEEIASRVTIRKNLWYLDGTYTLEGKHQISAYIKEEEL